MQLEALAETIPPITGTRARGVLQAVFSFPAMLGALLVVLSVLTVRSRLDDPDMWWHLKTGEIIWNTHSIPTTDEFSFSTNHYPYVPHEWLSQLSIYGAWKAGGYTGLMAWLCILTSLLLIAGYALCSLYGGNAKVAFLGALAIWLFSTIGLAIRPQLIGYLLLVCELLVIHLGRTRDSRWFFALPPLFALWVNCHGSFFLGLLVLAAFLFCSFFEFRAGLLVCERWERKRSKTLAVSLALSLAALFVNPIGINQVLYPINTMFGQHLGLSISAEWLPLSMDDVRAYLLFAVAAGILIACLLRGRELRLNELFLLAFGFYLGASHQRLLFVFGILAAPVLCRLLGDAWDSYDPKRDRALPNAAMISLAALAVVLGLPDSRSMQLQVEKQSPVKAVAFIRHSGLSGRMLNQYVYGGYLIWAAPEHKVFMDGRSDVYEWTGVLADYSKWERLEADPTWLLNKYKIDFCLLGRDAPMSRVLPLLPGWKKVYMDDSSVIFARL
jgi:hypothetical protein